MPQPGSRRGSVVGFRLTALAVFSALVATLLVASPAAAEPQQRSDAVRAWNLHAVNALINATSAEISGAGQTPPVSELHLAMVQGAVYDAVNAIEGGYQPYLSGLPAVSPAASQDAAVATAAHHVLVGLSAGGVPLLSEGVRARLDALYAEELAGIPDGAAKTDGIAAGAAAAAAMLAARANDGRYVLFSFTIGTDPGEWRPTPPANVNDPFAWIAKVDPFILDSPSQFRTKGPHALTSGVYAKEYNEVKALGAPGSSRTPTQEALAQFYTVNPVELFNRTFRTIAAAEGLTIAEEARLFAMLNMAGADSLINCWDDKAFWRFWRPITAIHEGDNDGNKKTVADPSWTSLIPAPPYPDHPSGYNCVTAAMMYTARYFFGTNKLDFNVVKIVPGTPEVTRVYRRFTDVVADTIDARIYQGLHFRAADVQGAGIGKDVARWLNKHFFQPVK
jgi:Vanadium chloroperoxidase N-terminal domain/PAP2 superfamily